MESAGARPLFFHATCAAVGNALVICLPGKPKGAVECLGFVEGAIPHCVEVVAGVPTSC